MCLLYPETVRESRKKGGAISAKVHGEILFHFTGRHTTKDFLGILGRDSVVNHDVEDHLLHLADSHEHERERVHAVFLCLSVLDYTLEGLRMQEDSINRCWD
jgi:hypothetical protein